MTQRLKGWLGCRATHIIGSLGNGFSQSFTLCCIFNRCHIVGNGSGLYDTNRISAAQFTALLAAVHRDVEVSPYDTRLVYGGHTVALAQASLGRVLSGLATVVGWHACSHTAPVFEGDILSCHHTLVAEQSTAGGTLRAVHIDVLAHRPGTEPVSVLDWTPIVLTT